MLPLDVFAYCYYPEYVLWLQRQPLSEEEFEAEYETPDVLTDNPEFPLLGRRPIFERVAEALCDLAFTAAGGLKPGFDPCGLAKRKERFLLGVSERMDLAPTPRAGW